MIHPINGEQWRVMVDSHNRPGIQFLVDLSENDFSGQCSCEHFVVRCGPSYRNGKRGNATRCKHIREARDAWFDVVAPMVDSKLNEKYKPK